MQGIRGHDNVHVKEFCNTTTRGWLFGDFGVLKSLAHDSKMNFERTSRKCISDVIEARTNSERTPRNDLLSVTEQRANREKLNNRRTKQKGDFYEWM